MSKDYSHLDNTTFRWYVMLHKNPQKLDLMLKRENAACRSTQGDMRQIEYFIPFCFLSRVHETGNTTVVKAASFANQLRDDFHDFAFFHTTERGIAMLLDRPWNTGLRYRLRHFRDLQRNVVVISDAEMNTHLRVFSERKLKYTIGLPVADPSPDMTVSITANGPFNGQTARVVAVKHTSDGISLTLGVTLFKGVRELRLPDFRLSDINMERDTEDIIGWTFIQTVEATLLDILSRRIHHKETDESRQEDSDTLNRLFLYSYITISDAAVSAYFLALMLICSRLRFDRDSTAALIAKAKSLVEPSDIRPQTSDISSQPSVALPPHIKAALCFALYIATLDANYRTMGKQTLQQLTSNSPLDPKGRLSEQEQLTANSQQPTANSSHSSLSRLASLASRLHSKRKR